MIIQSRPKVPD